MESTKFANGGNKKKNATKKRTERNTQKAEDPKRQKWNVYIKKGAPARLRGLYSLIS